MKKRDLAFLFHYFDQNYHPVEIRKDSVVRIVSFQARLKMLVKGVVFLGLLFLSATVFFLNFTIRNMDYQSMFFEPGDVTPAVITEISNAGYSENDNAYMEYAYTYKVNGKSYEGKSYQANSTLEEGDSVIVTLSKNSPEVSKIKGMRMHPVTPWMLLFLLPFLAVGIGLIIYGMYQAWNYMLFIRYGEIAQADVLKIETVKSEGETTTYSDDVSVEFETKKGEKIFTVINVPSFVRSRHTNSIRIIYLPFQPNKGIFYKSLKESELRIIENKR